MTFVPSLLPVELPPTVATIWPNAAQASFSIEKSIAFFFNLLPREFISRLLSLILQEFYDCKPTALWQSGGVFSGPSFKLFVRLESQLHEHKIIIEDQSLHVSKALSSSSKTQLLVVQVRACDEEAGFQAMQNVFKLVNKIKVSYIGIRSWQLAQHCCLHDGVGDCIRLAEMADDPIWLSTKEPIAANTVKQLRVTCGLELGEGLEGMCLFMQLIQSSSASALHQGASCWYVCIYDCIAFMSLQQCALDFSKMQVQVAH
jgi:hypothetical protein